MSLAEPRNRPRARAPAIARQRLSAAPQRPPRLLSASPATAAATATGSRNNHTAAKSLFRGRAFGCLSDSQTRPSLQALRERFGRLRQPLSKCIVRRVAQDRPILRLAATLRPARPDRLIQHLRAGESSKFAQSEAARPPAVALPRLTGNRATARGTAMPEYRSWTCGCRTCRCDAPAPPDSRIWRSQQANAGRAAQDVATEGESRLCAAEKTAPSPGESDLEVERPTAVERLRSFGRRRRRRPFAVRLRAT